MPEAPVAPGGISREDPGLLMVLSGPSGAGKGTVRKEVLKRHPDFVYGVSVTTRPPRKGEQAGRDYFFLSKEEFEARRQKGQFVEWAEVYGHCYATPREPMESQLKQGRVVIIEKDIQGALTLKKGYPDGAFVFILPPSLSELRRRIRKRGSESEEALKQRLDSASDELNYLHEYDYVVLNDRLEDAVERMEAIILAERCRVSRRKADTPTKREESSNSERTDASE